MSIERSEIEVIQEDKLVEEEILERNVFQRATLIIVNSVLDKKIKNLKPGEKISEDEIKKLKFYLKKNQKTKTFYK